MKDYYASFDGEVFDRCAGEPTDDEETAAADITAALIEILKSPQLPIFREEHPESKRLALLLTSVMQKVKSAHVFPGRSQYIDDFSSAVSMMMNDSLRSILIEEDDSTSPTKMFLLGFLAQQAIAMNRGFEAVVNAGEQELERREIVSEERRNDRKTVDREIAISALKGAHHRLGRRARQKSAARKAAAKKLQMGDRTLTKLIDQMGIVDSEWYSPE